MLKVAFDRVKPGQEKCLREWFSELMRRADEVRASFVAENVRHEQAYLVRIGNDTCLVYAIECEDIEKAREAFNNSVLPIDVEHKRVMNEVLDKRVIAELLYDCSVE